MSNLPPLAELLRTARGSMSASELAALAGWQISKISKIEHGKQLPSRDDLDRWAEITGATTADLQTWRALLTTAQEARRDMTLQIRAGQRAFQRSFTDLIKRTTRFRIFETTVIPRFLQTPDYSRAILTESLERHGVGTDIEAAVTERQSTVDHLFHRHRSFELIIAESVLGWRPAALTRPVHRAQLEHLLHLVQMFSGAGAVGNVRIGIVPLFRPIGWVPRNSFHMFDDYAGTEHWIGEVPFLLTDETDRLHKIMDKMWETACEGDQAAQIIQNAIDTLANAPD